MADLMNRVVTEDTALGLRMSDGSFHVYYPRVMVGKTYRELIDKMNRWVRSGEVMPVGDPDRYSDLCSVMFVNAAQIVSFVKQGGSR